MIQLLPSVVYLLCMLTSTACAYLLGRAYARTRLRLLFWSSLCFAFLAANNIVVVVDMLVLPGRDLQLLRHGLSLAGVAVLLFGFVWEREA